MRMYRKDYCILLTGTIKPSIVYSLKRTDPNQRERDYYTAISEWLQFKIPVVFCENSNYYSVLIKNLESPYFEFIQYSDSDDLSSRGKGFGEARIMEYAMKKSRIISEHEYIIKVTGRLFIRNIISILKIADNSNFDVMAPLENKLKWADSRLFIFNKLFYQQYFSKSALKIDDSIGFCFERALACSIHDLLADNRNWEMLPFYPKYKGYSGTYNEAYSIFKKGALLKIISFPVLRYLIKF
jgi:hypothetical protein